MRRTRSSCLRLLIRSQSRQSRRTVPTQRSANAFAFGARNGVRMISTPSLWKTSSKARLNFALRSWIRKRIGLGRSESDQANWRLLRCPAPIRVGGAAGEVPRPRSELEEEEHVQASEPERLNGEEVAGEHRLGMRTQELTPAEPSPGVGGRQAGLPEDLGHRRGRDAHAHTCQLTDDQLVAPTWVLAGKAQHQLMDLFRHRRPTRSPSSVRPPSPYKLAMPAQQRVGTNEERLPVRAGQNPAGRREEHPVSLVQARTGDLAAKNRKFVSKHHDLELLELARAYSQRRHRKHTPKQEVQQRHDQEAASLHRVQKEPTLRSRTSSDPPGRIRRIYVPHAIFTAASLADCAF